MPRCLSLAAVLLLACPTARAGETAALDNWPQWRGPLADGTAPHGDPPLKWDDKTNVKWKTALPGQGASTPVVWGDKVFVLTAEDTGREAAPADVPAADARLEKKTTAPRTYFRFLVLCFDRITGKERWRQTAAEAVPHEGHHPTTTYAAASPVTDGKTLFVSFGSFGVYAYDLDGKQLWKRDFGRVQSRLGWGEGASPALSGDMLVVPFDQEVGSFIVALDARTGATRWRVDRDEPTSWATPLIVEHGGRTQAVVNGTKRVRSYDLTSGKLLWECGGQTLNAIPSPVTNGKTVYVMSGYKGSLAAAVSLDASGDVTDGAAVAWKHTRGTPYVPSPVLTGDRLYFTLANSHHLTVLDAHTGKVLVDRERLTDLKTLYASPVAAAGRIYFTDRAGTTVVLKQSDKIEVLAVNRIGEEVNASPAVVGRQLFLRGDKHLYCLEAD